MCNFVGWDIGGAHLKAVQLDDKGNVLHVLQLACPLWRGLQALELAMQNMLQSLNILPQDAYHSVTMTGELVDYFDNRNQGVRKIAQFVANLLGKNVFYYATNGNFVAYDEVKLFSAYIASSNWHASASAIAMQVSDALLIDIGSTTTDIIVIQAHKVKLNALDICSDSARLQNDTLVYTGVVRTPVMALAQKLFFDGREINVMAEYFATMADVYRLTNELLPQYDMAETADGKGKTKLESARRLARMIGHDVQANEKNLQKWLALAHTCRLLQVAQIKSAMLKQLKPNMPIIGVGAGAFLVSVIAAELNHPYLALSQVLPKTDIKNTAMMELCFSAYAVAYLALKRQVFKQKNCTP